MFQSATLKLTGWYLCILMGISFVFSVAIYTIASSEINAQLTQLQEQIIHNSAGEPRFIELPPNSAIVTFRESQSNASNRTLIASLVYVNLLILVGGGAVSYWLARRTLYDIEQAHEAQSRFTSDASHELRTPLSAMKTELEVALRDRSITKQELKETLSSSLEEVDKLSRLSTMLLRLARSERVTIKRSTTDIRAATERTIKRFNMPESRLRFVNYKDTVRAHSHADTVDELLTILIDNALKYSPDDTQVVVRTLRRNGKVGVSVTNLGAGISVERLPHIFERFYRGDASRTNGPHSGHGLGLALAKQLTTAIGGDLLARSASGHPTTFTLLLPPVKRTKQPSTPSDHTDQPY